MNDIKSTLDRLMQQGDDVFALLLIDSTERYEQALAIMEHLVMEAEDSSQNPSSLYGFAGREYPAL